MGFNSTVLILNDRLSEIAEDPKGFVEEMLSSIHAHPREPLDFYPGQSSVMSCEHADVVTILAVGGNCSTVLGKFYNGGHHHTEEAQLTLLRELAAARGFYLRKKRSR